MPWAVRSDAPTHPSSNAATTRTTSSPWPLRHRHVDLNVPLLRERRSTSAVRNSVRVYSSVASHHAPDEQEPYNHRTMGRIMNSAVVTLASIGLAAMLAERMPAQLQERLRVLADTPLRPALLEIGEAFRRGGRGQQVEFVFDSSPAILEKLAAGETADVLIVQPDHIADLMKSGTVVRGEHPLIGRVGLGLAIRADAPPQSIATEGLLREVLLKADTLLFNTVVSGDQFAAVLERMNLTNAVKSKVVRLPPGPAIYDRVIRGKGNDIAAGVIPSSTRPRACG